MGGRAPQPGRAPKRKTPTITSAWPAYQTGPEKSIFALGVVSVNYATFERSLMWVFAAVSGLPEEYAKMIVAKTNNNDRTQLVRQMLDKRDWPEPAKELVSHFIKRPTLRSRAEIV